MAAFEHGKLYHQLCKEADKRYDAALRLAQELDPTHGLRLALYLGYALLYGDVKHDFVEAISIAEEGFEMSLNEIESLDEADLDETIKLMVQL